MTCASVAAIVALSAFGGAVGLIGGGLSLGEEVTPRLPFDSPVLGGVALIVAVGIPFGVLTWQALRGERRAAQRALGAAALLMGWLVVEICFIREFSFFHPLYAFIAVGFFWFGLARARHERLVTVDPGQGRAEPMAGLERR